MFKNAYQSGLLSIFYSCGAKPLELWDVEVKNGHIKRLTDNEVRSIVLEIGGSNVSTTFITCPKGNKSLGITLPYMVMIVKSLKKHFTFEVTVLDQTGAKRRFRISNFQSTTQILPLCTTMPIALSDGWNQIQFNLAEFTQRSYKTQFMEVQKLKINANIRLRRVYFTEVLLPDDQLPPEYKLYVPLSTKKQVKKLEEVKGKEIAKPSPPKEVEKQTIVERKDALPLDGARESSKTSIRSIKKSSHIQASKTKIENNEATEPVSIEEKLAIDNNVKSKQITEDEKVPISNGGIINSVVPETATAQTEPIDTLIVETAAQEIPPSGSNEQPVTISESID